MRKLYEALSVDVVKFEAQDVITVSGMLSDPSNSGSNNDPVNDPNGGNGNGSDTPTTGGSDTPTTGGSDTPTTGGNNDGLPDKEIIPGGSSDIVAEL